MKRADSSSKNKLLSPSANSNNPKLFHARAGRAPTNIETSPEAGLGPSGGQLTGTPSSKPQLLTTPKSQHSASPKQSLDSKLTKGYTPQSMHGFKGHYSSTEFSSDSQERASHHLDEMKLKSQLKLIKDLQFKLKKQVDDIQREAKNCVAKSKRFLKDYSFLILVQLKNTVEKNDYSEHLIKPVQEYGTPNKNLRSPERTKTFKNYSELIKNITRDKIDVVAELKTELEDQLRSHQRILSTLLEENKNFDKQEKTDNSNISKNLRQIRTEVTRDDDTSAEVEEWKAEKPSTSALQVLDLEKGLQELRSSLKAEEGTISPSKETAHFLAEDLIKKFEKLKANFISEEMDAKRQTDSLITESMMKTPKNNRSQVYYNSELSKSPKAEDFAAKDRYLNQIIAELKRELEFQTNRNLVINQKLEAAVGESGNSEEVKTLRVLLDESKDEIKRLKGSNWDLNNKIKKLEQDAVEKSDALRDLENDFQNIFENHKKILEDFREQREYTANLELLAESLEAQSVKLKKDISMLEGQNNDLENQIKFLKKSPDNASNPKSATAQDNPPKDEDFLMQTCMNLERENQILREDTEKHKFEAEEALAVLVHKIQQASAEKESLKLRLIKQGEFIGRLENELREKGQSISTDNQKPLSNSNLELEVKRLQETLEARDKLHALEISYLRKAHQDELKLMKQPSKSDQPKVGFHKSDESPSPKKQLQQLDDFKSQLQKQETLQILAEKQKRETHLIEENERLRADVHTLRSLLDDSGHHEQIGQLESAMKHLNARIKQQTEAWVEKENAYQTKLDEMNADYDQLKQRYNENLENLGEDMESALVEREELHKDIIDQYITKITGLEQELALIQETIAETQAREVKLANEVQTISTEKEVLADHLRQLQESLKNSGDQVVNKEIDRLLEQIDAIQKELNNEREAIVSLNSEVREHKKAEFHLKEQIKQLITSELAKAQEIMSLKNQITEAEALKIRSEKNLSDQIGDSEKRCLELEEQLDLTQREGEEAEKSQLSLHQELIKANNRFVESEKIVINLQSLSEASNRRVGELEETRKELQNNLENAKIKYAELEKNANEQRSKLERAQMQLEEAEKAKAALFEKLETIQNQRITAGSSGQELQKKLEGLKHQLEKAENDKVDLSNKLESARVATTAAEDSKKNIDIKLQAADVKNAELMRSITDIKDNLEKAAREKLSLETSRLELLQAAKGAEDQIVKLDKEKLDLQERLKVSEKQITELEKSRRSQEEIIRESGNLIQQLRQEKTKFQEEGSLLASKVKEQSSTINLLNESIVKLTKEKDVLHEDLDEMKNAQQAAGKSKQLIQDLQNTYREKENRLQANIAELNETNTSIHSTLTEKFEKQYEELEQLSLKKIQNLEEQIINLQEDNRVLYAEVEALRSNGEKPTEESEEVMFFNQPEEINKEVSNIDLVADGSVQNGPVGTQRNKKRREEDKKASLISDRDESGQGRPMREEQGISQQEGFQQPEIIEESEALQRARELQEPEEGVPLKHNQSLHDSQQLEIQEFDSKSLQMSQNMPENTITSETQEYLENQPGSPYKMKNFDWKAHYKNLQKAYDRAREKIRTLTIELDENKRKQTKLNHQPKEHVSESSRGNRKQYTTVYVQKTEEETEGILSRNSEPAQLVQTDKQADNLSLKNSKAGNKKEKQPSNLTELNYYKKTIVDQRNQIFDFEIKLKQEIRAKEKQHEQNLQETEQQIYEEVKRLKEIIKAKDREIDDLRWDEAIKMNQLEKEVEKRLAEKYKAPAETKKKKK